MRDSSNLSGASPGHLAGLCDSAIRRLLLPFGHVERDAHRTEILPGAIVQFARDPAPLVILRTDQARGKLAQLLITLLQLGCSLPHLLFEFTIGEVAGDPARLFGFAQFLLSLLAFGDIPIDFQPDGGFALGLFLQGGTASYVKLRAVAPRVNQ